MKESHKPAGSADTTCIIGFDLLGLIDRIVLPSAVLSHLDINTRKLLRVCCKRLRAEVDAHVTSITVNRWVGKREAAGARRTAAQAGEYVGNVRGRAVGRPTLGSQDIAGPQQQCPEESCAKNN
jgi:hypothetical protein